MWKPPKKEESFNEMKELKKTIDKLKHTITVEKNALTDRFKQHSPQKLDSNLKLTEYNELVLVLLKIENGKKITINENASLQNSPLCKPFLKEFGNKILVEDADNKEDSTNVEGNSRELSR